jgi:branched-chain amino acid transport system substrate-binding protein
VSVVPQNAADVDKLYGSRQEVGCTMPPRQI